jgi:hypothetical protein
MRCPRCGFENPEGLKFCGECGTAVTAPCPRCGFVNPPQFKFCGDCGVPLVPASRPSSTPSLAAQPQPPSRYTPAYLAEKILTKTCGPQLLPLRVISRSARLTPHGVHATQRWTPAL